MAKKTSHKGSVGTAVALGAGIAAATAAAYVLFGPEGKKNRKAIKGWTVKMKGEIIEKLEEAKDLTEPVYHKIVDQISEKYAKAKGIDQAELASVIAQVRKHWKAMAKDAKPAVKKAKATVKKAKTAVKKAVKKGQK